MEQIHIYVSTAIVYGLTVGCLGYFIYKLCRKD